MCVRLDGPSYGSCHFCGYVRTVEKGDAACESCKASVVWKQPIAPQTGLNALVECCAVRQSGPTLGASPRRRACARAPSCLPDPPGYACLPALSHVHQRRASMGACTLKCMCSRKCLFSRSCPSCARVPRPLFSSRAMRRVSRSFASATP